MALDMLKRDKAGPGSAVDGGPTYPIPSPVKPSALLIPSLILEQRAESKTKTAVIQIVVAVVAVLALVSLGVVFLHMKAAHNLTSAQAEEQAAAAKVARYADVAAYSDGLQKREQALQQQLLGDVSYSTMLRTLLDSVPSGLSVASVEVQPGQPCPGPNPFTPTPVMGCVKIAGTANSSTAIGTFVDTLNHLPADTALTQAFVNSVTGGVGGAQFSLSVNYTEQALSHRFVGAHQIAAMKQGTTSTGVTP